MIQFLSLFSGIGAFEKALDRQGIEYNLVNYCEFDKYAGKSYSAIHNVSESLNLGDITKIDVESLPQVDLITYGFPCQDISSVGKQKGLFNEDGSRTRSGLFFNALEIIEHCKPKVAIAENVKNLTSKKFSEQFETVLSSLEESGYNNYWKVLNSKDYGIPQNRERVFIVSIRKDVDTGVFEFPKPYELKVRLKDLLEKEVDEKYFLSEDNLKWLNHHNEIHEKKGTGFKFKPKNPETDYASCLRATPSWAPTDNAVIVRSGRVGHGVAQTPAASCNQGVLQNVGIRRLTPKEYFRLQGFSDSDCDSCISAGISNTQLYKQAGNSITVDVLEELFCMIFDEEGNFYI